MINFNEIDACIFDMDGTLIESMEMWRDSGDLYLEYKGIKKTKEIPLVDSGKEYNELTVNFIEHYNIADDFMTVKKDFEAAVTPFYHEKLQFKDGAEDFIKNLYNKGIKMCVATATKSDLAKICFKRLGADKYFDAIISTKDIGINKYSPDVYLKCCQIMKTVPQRTLVFEDALYAANTAMKAGFQVVGIYDNVFGSEFEKLKSICTYSINGYEDLAL